MRSEQRNRTAKKRKTQGFTLMELMTVVIIVGVLSAIAIPTFSSYIYKSRTTEATEFLGVIRLREEAYRSEFGTYAATLAAAASPNQYASLTTSNMVPDPTTTRRDPKAFVATQPWLQLGARPSGPVRFGYGVVAGIPSDVPTTLGWTDATADFWFVARALGDLNGDDKWCTFEIYSASKNMWISDPKGRGWD